MKLLKYFLLSLLALLALILLIALFVPRKYTISVAENINKPKSTVYDYVKMLKNQEYYSEWIKADPNLRPEITGEDGSVGAIQSWNSKINDVGEGTQTITAITDDRIDTDLNFIRPFKGTAKTAQIFTAIDSNSTKLTTEFYSNAAYPMNLMSYLFGRKMIEEVSKKNLANLKKIIETMEEPTTRIAPTGIDTTKLKYEEEKKY